MKFNIKAVLSVLLLVFVMLLAGCKGKEGDPGPAGKDGPQGIGFDEAVKYGNVVLHLVGTSDDGVAFNDTIDFKFASHNLDYSSVTEYQPDNIQTRIRRWSGFDNYYDDDYFAPDLRVQAFGTDTTYYIYTNIRVFIPLNNAGGNREFVKLQEGWYNDDGSNIEDEEVKGYKYDKDKGTLYYRFSYKVPAASSGTNHDMQVSGTVNALVFISEED